MAGSAPSHGTPHIGGFCADPRIQEAARRAYRLFAMDPRHPSLRFKKLAGSKSVWSVRIERDGEVLVWFWIGSHNDFDKRFG